MKIAVIGLGYVGSVFAPCVSSQGLSVVGIDSVEEKVNSINSGFASFYEPGLNELVAKEVSSSRLSATTNLIDGTKDVQMAFICVGTPNRLDGHLDTTQIFSISSRLVDNWVHRNDEIVLAIRSTVEPGTCEAVQDSIDQILETHNSMATVNVVYCPEFLREGTAVNDYFNPPYIVLGYSPNTSDKTKTSMENLFKNINQLPTTVSIRTAELIKYISNSWHALKISFANEIGLICREENIIAEEVLNLFCKDEKLNISTAYLRPGSPYGGSCLPKDLAGLNAIANRNNISVPILHSISKSNARAHRRKN